MASYSLLSALMVGLAWRWAASHSGPQVLALLGNANEMLNVAVLLNVEVIVHLTFCILSAQRKNFTRLQNIVFQIVRLIPSLFVFLSFIALEVYTMVSNPGIDFQKIAWLMAIAIFIITPIATVGLRYLFPEKELRLEVIFHIAIMMMLMGVIATVNGRTAAVATDNTDVVSSLSVAALLMLGIAAGVLNFYIKKKANNKNNQ